MLERFRAKNLPRESVSVLKGSVENLEALGSGMFDAAVLMNVLYAVNDPLGCLRAVHQILRPGGVLALSTTHHETRLDPLLNDIRQYLQRTGRFDELGEDYERLRDTNKDIEVTLAQRHTREEYCGWIEEAGFEITRYEKSTYLGAVMLVHARKKEGTVFAAARAVGQEPAMVSA
jgi:ubiquinone/menaquinone biosynthesis C-methylase UbiE